MKILIIQTAFAGDLILALPLVQETRRLYPYAELHVLCIPATAPLLENHPSVHEIVTYDKRGGWSEFHAIRRKLRNAQYDLCISPHRSLRSAILAFASRAPQRVCFHTAAGAFLYTDTVRYNPQRHEVERNLELLSALSPFVEYTVSPKLYPAAGDEEAARNIRHALHRPDRYVCIAPGSVWATKRWTEEGFAELIRLLAADHSIVLIGGGADTDLCERILRASGVTDAVNAAGKLPFLATAALLRDSQLLVSNDSAPVHIASAMETPTVDIYGSTVPEFGFAPWRIPHRIVQIEGLPCKPCGIHGRAACPIKTFVCMKDITAEFVATSARAVMLASSTAA